jgi:hypothetical protein
VDLNEMPARTQVGDETKTTVDEAMLERFLALRRTGMVCYFSHPILPLLLEESVALKILWIWWRR